MNNAPQIIGLLIVIISVLLILYGLAVMVYKDKIHNLKNDILNKNITIQQQNEFTANLIKKINTLENNGSNKVRN